MANLFKQRGSSLPVTHDGFLGISIHGLHAGIPGGPLDKLTGALKTYIDYYDVWYDLEFEKEVRENEIKIRSIEAHWKKQVGGAQLLLPVHAINEYCRPDRSFVVNSAPPAVIVQPIAPASGLKDLSRNL